MKRILMAILAALGICTSCSASDVNELSPQQFNDAVNRRNMPRGILKTHNCLTFLTRRHLTKG